MPRAIPLLTIAAALAMIAGGARGHAAPAAQPGSSLLQHLGFSASDIQKLNAGAVVARSLPAESSEVALAVAARMSVTPGFYVERFRNIVSFKTSPEVLQIGKIDGPPSTRDFASLTLENDDVNDLRTCRLDHCGVKLDREGIERMARPDADIAGSSAAMREFLASYTARYLERGNATLIEYRNDQGPRPLLADLKQILARSKFLEERWPDVFRAVAEFNGSATPGVDGFLYWSKEKVGPRAVVSVTHVVFGPPRDDGIAVATKQIYASHYSDASLGLTLLIPQQTGPDPKTLVIYTNRSRLDVFGGIFGGLKRPIVRSRARDGAARTMERLRERTERQFRGTQADRERPGLIGSLIP